MYPMLRADVSLATFTCESDTKEHYIVINPDGNEYELSYKLYHILENADGTHPLSLSRNLKRRLERDKIITTSRFVLTGVINRLIVFAIGNRSKNIYQCCQAVNKVLAFASLPLFLLAMLLMLRSWDEVQHSFNAGLYYGLFILSLVAHEFGHLSAGVSAGYTVTDVCLLLLGIFPIGAYVACRDNTLASKRERIQLSLAGIEAELFMVGLLIILALIFESYTLVMSANTNVLLIIINSLPVRGLDGEAALSALFEVKSISNLSTRIILDSKKRKRLFQSGIIGKMCLMFYFIVFLLKIVFIIYIIFDVCLLIFNLI